MYSKYFNIINICLFLLDIGTTNCSYFKQVPETKTNLIEVSRSLTDPINYTNHTVEFTKRKLAWQEAHSKLILFVFALSVCSQLDLLDLSV